MNPAIHLCHLAESAASRAAEYLRGVATPFDPASWSAKRDNDFVTEHDRRAEELIGELLLTGAPDSTIVGEELSPDAPRQGLCWIVDPIDGTTNFAHGFPVYSVSIAAEVDGQLLAGVVVDVVPNRVARAWSGGGAWIGERRLRVSTIEDPAHALIGTGFPFKHPEHLPAYQAQFARIAPATAGIRRAGSAALDLCWVASGSFDGFWELKLSPWDMAAGLVLVKEAGGLVTDLSGNPIGAMTGPVVAGNPAVHRWLLSML
ncbi:MAG: inositol monophosphatase [Gemmatimonadetes bacterium]|nr:inositol monophosphatase [Gemmatimonadota bacterium]